MSSPFVGEIRMFAGNFSPRGWAACNGQLYPISQNTALFSLLGTFYGGNGTSNFGLPNLVGRSPLGQGQGAALSPYGVGEAGGVTAVTLTTTQMASHTHAIACAAGTGNAGTQVSPAGGIPAIPGAARGLKSYNTVLGTGTPMNGAALTSSGTNAAHNNMAPFLAVNFIIALTGIFPSRN